MGTGRRSIKSLKKTLILLVCIYCCSCGLALDLNKGSLLGSATLEGSGGTRSDGSNFGQIYSVTQIVSAPSSPIPSWTGADFPFTGTPVLIGQPVTDGQTQFFYSFSYPPNNFQLADAHIVIDTSRDSSDTEGIFVDGIFSGRPPASFINLTSTKVTDSTYYNGAWPTPGNKNTYYIDYSVSHFKRLQRNSFDLNMSDLLKQTTHLPSQLLNDGSLPVITGDDSPVYQAYLVINGYTVSKNTLSCTQSPNYTFQNVYVHMDGNTIGQSTFTGTVRSPFDSWNLAPDPFQSVEFYFDSPLPRVQKQNVTLTSASLTLQVKRSLSGSAAIVINGIGVAEAGFNKTLATSAVEQWLTDSATVNDWTNFVTTIPANNSATTVTLNLIQLFGATRLRDLIAQGKLNISIAGSLGVVYGQAQANTNTRIYGLAAVDGPELNIQGTYYTQLCNVPNDPTSPIQDGAPLPTSCATDQTSPLITSLDASEITSSGATIQWLTDEGATTQTMYGIGTSDTLSALDNNKITFHRVQIAGLLPYKYYQFQAISTDSCGNTTISPIKLFRTLR